MNRLEDQHPNYRLWVNEGRTMLVRLWLNGTVDVALRETPHHTWGPPVYMSEEQTWWRA